MDDPQTLASLDLGRGTWVILAKATVRDVSVWPMAINCVVRPVHDEGAIYLGPAGKGMAIGSLAWLGIAKFASPDSIDLVCESNGSAGDSDMSNIEITAIKVDDAFVKLLPFGGMSSSSTQVLWHDAQRKACCTPYAKFDIPANSWLMMVTAQTYDPFDDDGGTVFCNATLRTSQDIVFLDSAALTLAPLDRPASQAVMSLSAGIS